MYLLILLFNITAMAQTCPKGQHWVNAHSRSAYFRHDGSFVQATVVSAHCRTNPQSYSFWETKFKSNLPKVWPHKSEQGKKWNTEEKERLFEALDIIPKVLWNDKISLYRAVNSKDFSNPATSADGIIVLYDSAFYDKDIKHALPRVLAHELAHQMYREFTSVQIDQYNEARGLEKDYVKSIGLLQTQNDAYVEEDGKESVEEDFANNIEYYLFNTDRLKSVTPKVHGWIKEKFGDKLKIQAGE